MKLGPVVEEEGVRAMRTASSMLGLMTQRQLGCAHTDTCSVPLAREVGIPGRTLPSIAVPAAVSSAGSGWDCVGAALVPGRCRSEDVMSRSHGSCSACSAVIRL